MEYYSAMRNKEILPFVTLDGPSGHYAKWNKPVKERQILHDITYMWNLKKKKKKIKLIRTENRRVIAWDGGGGEIGGSW